MIIDTHAHLYPTRYLDLIEAQGEKYPVRIVRDREGQRVIMLGGREFFTYYPKYIDVDVRLAEMEEVGIDFQVLSIAPPMVFWADAALGLDLCQVYNDELAAIVRAHPDKFVGLAALPLQDPLAAVRELERAVKELDMRGCLVGSNIHGKDLDAPELDEFFAALSRIDVPAYIHPILPAGRERMGDYRLDVLLGFPVDTTIAAARLVFGKVMERYPNLRLVLSHMGGTLPFLWGRISRGFDTFPEVKKHFPGDAAEWFKKFYYDSITFDPSILRNAIEWVGVGQVVFGTDDPFFGPDNMSNCLATVQECPGLSDSDKRSILTDTPRRLFGIEIN